jgi:hypothetical protein
MITPDQRQAWNRFHLKRKDDFIRSFGEDHFYLELSMGPIRVVDLLYDKHRNDKYLKDGLESGSMIVVNHKQYIDYHTFRRMICKNH